MANIVLISANQIADIFRASNNWNYIKLLFLKRNSSNNPSYLEKYKR